MKYHLLATLMALFSISTHADDKATAYKEAQQLLTNKEERQKVIQSSDKAKQSDEYADKVVMGDAESKDKLYKISADVLGNFSSDDPEVANKALAQAAKDPAAFLKSLTPEQKKAIQELAQSIEAKQKPAPAAAQP